MEDNLDVINDDSFGSSKQGLKIGVNLQLLDMKVHGIKPSPVLNIRYATRFGESLRYIYKTKRD